MIIRLVLMAVCNAAALGGAWALLTRIRSGQTGTDAVLFLVLHLALVSATTLVAGTLGLLQPLALGIAGVLGMALLRWKGGLARPAVSLKTADRGLLLVAAAIALKLMVQVWMLAPNIPDAISYHLPKVAEWTQEGRITGEMGLDPRVTFPAGFELVEIWWTLFLHHDVLIELAGVEFLLLAAAATYALARHVGLSAVPAGWAAVLYVLTPGVSLQAVSCLNDLPVAALILSGLALAAARVPPAMLLAVAGLGIGIKPTFGFALPGIALLWYLGRKQPRAAMPSPRLAWGLAVAAILIGSSWYGRNAVLYGNPIHPVGTQGYLGRRTGRVGQQLGPRLSSLVDNVSALAGERIRDRASPYTGVMVNIAAWGGVAFAVGAIALLLKLREAGPLRRLAGAFAVSLASVFLLVLPDAWSMRFALFFPALLAIAAAALAAELRGVAWIAGAAAAVQFACTIVPGDLYPGQMKDLWRQPWSQRANALMPWIESPDGAVAVFANGEGMEYLLYRPDFSRRVVRLRESTVEQIAERLYREKVRLVWCFTETPLLKDCLRRGLLRPLKDAFYLRH